jgi:hypothetical protein
MIQKPNPKKTIVKITNTTNNYKHTKKYNTHGHITGKTALNNRDNMLTKVLPKQVDRQTQGIVSQGSNSCPTEQSARSHISADNGEGANAERDIQEMHRENEEENPFLDRESQETENSETDNKIKENKDTEKERKKYQSKVKR